MLDTEPSIGPARIALVGDFNAQVAAHRAIPLALERARRDANLALVWEWIGTDTIDPADPASALASFDGVWCVPASPYASTEGALAAIGFARRSGRPFLGTCGGFQHALLEYARSVWGIAEPKHAELDPDAEDPVIAPLACSLVEVTGTVRPLAGSRLAASYGGASAPREGYHCRYGLDPRHAARLASGPLQVAAVDDAGEVRAIELDGHPFFVATLFQPERAALDGRSHPIVAAFAAAVASAAANQGGS